MSFSIDKNTFFFRKEEKKEEPLIIIPLLKCNTWHDSIINKINVSKSKTSNMAIQNVKIKEESNDISNGDSTSINMTSPPTNVQMKMELSTENKIITLEQVTKEIMEDLKSTEKNKDELCDITLSSIQKHDLNDAEEVSIFFTINYYYSDILITFCHIFKPHKNIINSLIFFYVEYIGRL